MGEAFYLEVGCEEIPAGYIGPALEAMALEMGRFWKRTASAMANQSLPEPRGDWCW